MDNTIKTEILTGLVTKLREQVFRHDGVSAVATLDLIEHFAGAEYRAWLMSQSRDRLPSDLVQGFPL